MKAGPYFEQGSNTTLDMDLTRGRRSDVRKQLQRRTFSGAIVSDDADGFARSHAKAEVAQSPEFTGRLPEPAHSSKETERCALRIIVNSIALRHIPEFHVVSHRVIRLRPPSWLRPS